MMLNVGAGMDDVGDVALDIVRTPRTDVLGTAVELPFADETFERVLLDQVAEHIAPEELPMLFEELYRVLEPDGIVDIRVPHAATRLYDQDPTHRSSWTYGTIEYFTDGNFSWYYDDRAFDFELVERKLSVWSHRDVRLSRVRSKLLQFVNARFGREDSLLYWPTVGGSIRFELRKVPTRR